MKKLFKNIVLILHFQYAVDVIGLPLYFKLYEWKGHVTKSKFHK